MSVVFPIPATDFVTTLKVTKMSFKDDHPQEASRLGDGTIFRASLGASLWKGSFTLSSKLHIDAAPVEAMLSRLGREDASFLVYDTRVNGPRYDQGGAILGTSTPVISALNSNNCEMKISGLPSGYILGVGDMIGFQYGTNPVRYGLHRLFTGAEASSGGGTPYFELSQRIRPGAQVGAAITLVRPVMKVMLDPGAKYGNGRPVITAGENFSFTQTLR